MASDISKYLGNKIIRWLGGQTFPAAPASIYVALFNGNPKGAGVEVTTTVRVAGRVAVDFEAIPAAGTDNDITTDGVSDFGAAAGAATVSYLALCDAASAGNVLLSKALAAPVTVDIGELVKVNAADLTITIGS